MPGHTAIRPLDPTPPRPGVALAAPAPVLTMEVEVDLTHLANPVLAISRLLASEAEAFARVSGDEDRITVSVVLPDRFPATRDRAEGWVRWVVHTAGVRGDVRCVDRTPTYR